MSRLASQDGSRDPQVRSAELTNRRASPTASGTGRKTSDHSCAEVGSAVVAPGSSPCIGRRRQDGRMLRAHAPDLLEAGAVECRGRVAAHWEEIEDLRKVVPHRLEPSAARTSPRSPSSATISSKPARDVRRHQRRRSTCRRRPRGDRGRAGRCFSVWSAWRVTKAPVRRARTGSRPRFRRTSSTAARRSGVTTTSTRSGRDSPSAAYAAMACTTSASLRWQPTACWCVGLAPDPCACPVTYAPPKHEATPAPLYVPADAHGEASADFWLVKPHGRVHDVGPRRPTIGQPAPPIVTPITGVLVDRPRRLFHP